MGQIITQSIRGTLVHYIGTTMGFFITMFAQTHFLTTEIIGLQKVVYDAGFLFCNLAMFGITSSGLRFFPYFKNDKNKDNGFFYYLLLIPTIGIIIFESLYVLLKGPISAFFSKNSALFIDYYNWVIPLIAFLAYWITFETYSNIKMRIVMPKFVREIGVRLMLLCLYLLYGFGIIDLTGFITGCISMYAIAMIIMFVYVSRFKTVTLKHDSSFVNSELRTKAFKYTGFMFLTTISGSVLALLDTFMVGSLKGLSFVGIYTIAVFMAAVVEIPSRSISAISAPIAAEALKAGDFERANNLYKKVSLHQLIAGSSIFLLIWINIENIFDIIPKGDVFVQGKWVVLFLAIGRLIYVTLNFGGTLISFSRYYYWGLFFTFFIAIIGILTNLWLIPELGITGAAIATLTTSVLSYSVQQWIVLKKVKGNPYTIGTFKQIGIILLLLAINYALPNWSGNAFVDAAYRTIIISALGVFMIYKFKVSTEVCRLADGFIDKYFRRK